MDQVQKVMFKAMISVERATAQAEVLEGVSADFFRLFLALDKSSPEEIKEGMAAVSEKLLAQHAQALQVKDAALLAVKDLKAGMAEAKARAAGAPEGDTAPPPLAAVPNPEPTEEAGD
jgi:hypothetical protein